MVNTAFVAENLPLILIASAVALSLLLWSIRLPRLSVFLLFVSVLIGQAVRVTWPGQGGGLLLSDIAVAVVLLAATLLLLRNRQKVRTKQFIMQLTLLLTPFLVWGMYTLAIKTPGLGFSASAIAASYLLRLTTNLLLIPALLVIAWQLPNKLMFQRLLSFVFLGLALLGFLQLAVLPDLAVLSGGWDPHQGRLVTTWLDPNFSGAVFMLGAWWFGWRVYQARTSQERWVQLGCLGVVLLALLATQSRGALAATGVAALIGFSLWLVRRRVWQRPVRLIPIVATLVSGFVLAALGGLFLGERLSGMVAFDPSAVARLSNLESAWVLVREVGVLGAGYNTYQFAAAEAGLGTSSLTHSRAGADNSLLTIWVTTGLFGLTLFIAPWLALIQWSLAAAWRGASVLSVVGLSIFGLFMHSQLTNSFLYSHLLIVLALIIAGGASQLWWSQSESSFLPS